MRKVDGLFLSPKSKKEVNHNDKTGNNVEAYISFIRKKIRYLDSKVHIKNIQGIGYRPEFTEEAAK